INAAVPEGFWDELKSDLVERFSASQYIDGLEEAILRAGDQLKSFFPYQSDDVNELPNQISYGKD
ncbi:MAG: TPM domain-containing protein, partial [Flavobacteriales bacterium]